MGDTLIDAYRRFARGESGVCQETGEGEAFAFADEHAIESAFGSCYDTERFVWLTRERGPIGPCCDAWIEQGLRARRIGLYARKRRAIDVSYPAILQTALGMGAERMASVLALATDADGRVRSNKLGSLSLHLRFLLEGWMKEGSIPLRDVVERMLHTAG